MKRVSAFFISFLFLLTCTEMHEVLKLPALILHFTYHRVNDSETSAIRFLHNHYAHQTDNDSDHEQDGKLPFKTGISLTSANWVATHHSIEPLSHYALPTKNEQSYSPCYNLLTGHLFPTWQPPNVA